MKHLNDYLIYVFYFLCFLTVFCKSGMCALCFFKYEEMEADSLKLSLPYKTGPDAAQSGNINLNFLQKEAREVHSSVVRLSYQS